MDGRTSCKAVLPSMAKPKKVAKAVPAFSISLQLGDRKYEGSGATAHEALMAVPKPDKMMGKGVLTITHGTLKKQMMFFPQRLKRLFYSKNFQAIQAKQLALLMK